jgi:pyrroline-5-carboxylate reductase
LDIKILNTAKLTFIGGGNMASSIIGGLINKGYAASQINASDPFEESRNKLQQQFGIATFEDNAEAVAGSDVIILSVKPQVLEQVCTALRPQLSNKPLIISIAAGIDMRSLDQWLANDLAIVRCMPNTPALVQTGASGLYANDRTSDKQRTIANDILEAVGIVQWLDSEDLIDPVTAVSGSGPAYYFLMMEAMIDAGIAQGLTREAATELTLQTALGAAKLAQSSDVDVAELRRRVTSPNGTTEQAILSFEADGLRDTVAKAMQKCSDRSVEMSKELGA